MIQGLLIISLIISCINMIKYRKFISWLLNRQILPYFSYLSFYTSSAVNNHIYEDIEDNGMKIKEYILDPRRFYAYITHAYHSDALLELVAKIEQPTRLFKRKVITANIKPSILGKNNSGFKFNMDFFGKRNYPFITVKVLVLECSTASYVDDKLMLLIARKTGYPVILVHNITRNIEFYSCDGRAVNMCYYNFNYDNLENPFDMIYRILQLYREA